MAKNNGDTPTEDNVHARLSTSAADKAKADKWFQRGKELGGKRQFEYAIEYYVNGLEFWPDAVEEGCKPLHGCAVARRQTGGKKAGLKDTMTHSMTDKDARKALFNSFWLFGRDPENLSYIEGILNSASRLHADDTARWAAGVFQKALESAPKVSAKQLQSLATLLEELGDRAAERAEAAFAVEVYRSGVEVLDYWRRRFPKDDSVESAVKNLSTKMTILKGKYKDGEGYRDSVVDTEEQMEMHDEQRSVQSDDRVEQLVASAEAEFKKNPDNKSALRKYIDLLTRREQDEDEERAIEVLHAEFKRTDDYGWKSLADDIRMKQLGRAVRLATKAGDAGKLKEQRISKLRFELAVYKERGERYPTDNRIRFEYGVRNFQASRFDEAIPLFQAARSDPKNRAACGMYLGRCFFRKGYHDQAIAALEEAIETHTLNDDDVAKTMLYWLGRAQQASGEAAAAKKTYGKLLQMDYNYGDVRARLDALPA